MKKKMIMVSDIAERLYEQLKNKSSGVENGLIFLAKDEKLRVALFKNEREVLRIIEEMEGEINRIEDIKEENSNSVKTYSKPISSIKESKPTGNTSFMQNTKNNNGSAYTL